jgi:hypothetical protein
MVSRMSKARQAIGPTNRACLDALAFVSRRNLVGLNWKKTALRNLFALVEWELIVYPHLDPVHFIWT